MPATVLDDAAVLQRPMRLPVPRGVASASVLTALRSGHTATVPDAVELAVQRAADDLTHDEDVQLALFCLYELHYGGFVGVDEDLEWDAHLLAARRRIEVAFEAELRARIPAPERPEPTRAAVASRLFEIAAGDYGPSLSKYLAKKATLEQWREFLVQRSVYTLKEADPHTWAIPRLSGRAKAALVEIQSDEYGGGHPARIHSAIFTGTMRAAGLDDAYGAYVDLVPAVWLAGMNLMSLFGLHRRLRGAIVGHLAAYEMTSSIPCRFYALGFRRLGFDEEANRYFEEHVEADAVHEQIAGRELAGGLVEGEPHLLDDVLFGALAYLTVDGWAGAEMLDAWGAGRSSLLGPIP